ncbi:MAG: hypothetical protein AB7U82_21050 [Blastocatellales bacterium]
MIFVYLLLLAPLSLALVWFHTPPLWVFVTAAASARILSPLCDGRISLTLNRR